LALFLPRRGFILRVKEALSAQKRPLSFNPATKSVKRDNTLVRHWDDSKQRCSGVGTGYLQTGVWEGIYRVVGIPGCIPGWCTQGGI